jgi:hypothetical protein
MTQIERIARVLNEGKTFSQKQAAQYGIQNLRARITEVRQQYGINVERILNSNGIPAYRRVFGGQF